MDASSPEYLDKQKVARSFEQAAETYQQVADFQRAIGANLLERLDDLNIQPNAIADIGAGTGDLARHLNQRYKKAQIYAIDIALRLLQKAKLPNTLFSSLFQRPTQHCICGDTSQLPLSDNSIDLLISNLMLQWCNDLHTVFSEWARVLKPQGIVLFSTFGPDTLKELRDSWRQVDNASHVNLFIDMHDIGDLLWQSGFINPVMDVDWTTRWYADVMTLVRELKALGAHNVTAGRARGLTGKEKWQAMMQCYEHHRQDKSLPATYEIIYGYAAGKQLEIVKQKRAKTTTNIPISHIGNRHK